MGLVFFTRIARSFCRSQCLSYRHAWANDLDCDCVRNYGRGAGVGRGLAGGVLLGVSVGLGVDVAVGVDTQL